jgi:hypothetical protein
MYDQIRKYWKYGALLIADILFFGMTSPASSAWVIVPAFILIMTTVYVIIRLLVAYAARIVTLKPATRSKIILLTSVAVGVILALQSIGQLTIRDVITLIPFIVVLYFYLSFSKSRQS